MPLPDPDPGLVEALRNRAAVAIVGSGMSLPAGGPTWNELLHGLAAQAYVTQPDKRPDIVEALKLNALGCAATLKRVLGPRFFDAVVDQIASVRDVDIQNPL